MVHYNGESAYCWMLQIGVFQSGRKQWKPVSNLRWEKLCENEVTVWNNSEEMAIVPSLNEEIHAQLLGEQLDQQTGEGWLLRMCFENWGYIVIPLLNEIPNSNLKCPEEIAVNVKQN